MPTMRSEDIPKTIEFLTRKLLSNRAGERTSACALLLCLHGLRESEAIFLAHDDIQSDKQTIFVRTLKGGLNRHVSIDRITWAALLREQTESRLRGAATVLSNSVGKALDRRNLRRTWYRWRRHITDRRYRLHDFRHTCARVVYDQSGHDPFAVKAVLGHRRIETTFAYLSRGTDGLEFCMPTTHHFDRLHNNPCDGSERRSPTPETNPSRPQNSNCSTHSESIRKLVGRMKKRKRK